MALATYALSNTEIIEYFRSPRKIKAYILSFKAFGPIIFIILYSLKTLLFMFPVAIFAIISGSLFGFWVGFLYSMIGAFLSATIAFSIGRYLARDFVKKYFSERIKTLKKSKIKGFSVVLYLRLIAIIPYDAFGYVVGVTKITYRDFILGTMLGITPEFLIYAYLGNLGIKHDVSLKEKIIFSLALIIIALMIHIIKTIIIKRMKKKKSLKINLLRIKKYKKN